MKKTDGELKKVTNEELNNYFANSQKKGKCSYCGMALKAEDYFADMKKHGGKLTRKETIIWNKTVKQISPDIQNWLNQFHKGC